MKQPIEQQLDRSPRGMIFTFYSFKGGVGRSMALANVAVLLARWGQRVLIVDWDLEAPGLRRFFDSRKSRVTSLSSTRLGIIDLVLAKKSGAEIDWHTCVHEQEVGDIGNPVSLITAGDDDPEYYDKLQRLNWDDLFENHDLGLYLEELRSNWLSEYDTVLIDSRTGVSDAGGICTVLLPDVLVTLFTTTWQSVNGTVEAIGWARARRALLPVDRSRLLVVPVPSRDESNVEYERTLEWRRTYAEKFASIYADWLPKLRQPADIVNKLYIPYVAIWSFGETLPVLEEDSDNPDPRSITAAYITLAKLLKARLNWSEIESKESLELQEATRNLANERRMRRRFTVLTAVTGTLLAVGLAYTGWRYTTKLQQTEQLVASLSVATDADEANGKLKELGDRIGNENHTYKSLAEHVADLLAGEKKYDLAAEYYTFLFRRPDTNTQPIQRATLAMRAADVFRQKGDYASAAEYYSIAVGIVGKNATDELVTRLVESKLRLAEPASVYSTLDQLSKIIGPDRINQILTTIVIEYSFSYKIPNEVSVEVCAYLEAQSKKGNFKPTASFWEEYATAAEKAGDKERAEAIRTRMPTTNKQN